jgi:carbonic anhydrase
MPAAMTGVVVPFRRHGRPALDRDEPTPAGALRRLLDGNRRFVAGLPARSRDGAYRAPAAARRTPFAAVLGCSDSRVAYENVFDQAVGSLFVVQGAGNVVAAGELASLEFAAALLEVRVIVVLGHVDCRAVAAALAGEPVAGLSRYVAPARRACSDFERAVEDNVRAQRRALLDGSSVVADLAGRGMLRVAAAVYDGATGMVRVVA